MDDVYSSNLDNDCEVDGHDGSIVVSGRWKELRFKFDRYRHLLVEWGASEVPDSFSGLLDRLIVDSRLIGPSLTVPSGDTAAPSVTSLRDRVASLERQLTTEDQNLNLHQSDFMGRPSAADERAGVASTSSQASL